LTNNRETSVGSVVKGKACPNYPIVNFWIKDIVCTGDENVMEKCSFTTDNITNWRLIDDCDANSCIELVCNPPGATT